ncbi:Uncharacterised protein [Escherichia coli]|nr:Uncharacterised protein [Escherichia coli]
MRVVHCRRRDKTHHGKDTFWRVDVRITGTEQPHILQELLFQTRILWHVGLEHVVGQVRHGLVDGHQPADAFVSGEHGNRVEEAVDTHLDARLCDENGDVNIRCPHPAGFAEHVQHTGLHL